MPQAAQWFSEGSPLPIAPYNAVVYKEAPLPNAPCRAAAYTRSPTAHVPASSMLHQGPEAQRRGPTGTLVALADTVAGRPQIRFGQKPPNTRESGGPLPQVRNTLHTARSDITHSHALRHTALPFCITCMQDIVAIAIW